MHVFLLAALPGGVVARAKLVFRAKSLDPWRAHADPPGNGFKDLTSSRSRRGCVITGTIAPPVNGGPRPGPPTGNHPGGAPVMRWGAAISLPTYSVERETTMM